MPTITANTTDGANQSGLQSDWDNTRETTVFTPGISDIANSFFESTNPASESARMKVLTIKSKNNFKNIFFTIFITKNFNLQRL